jgi:hypothetical protein
VLFAAAGLLFIAFIALAFVGVSEAKVGVRRLDRQMDEQSPASGAETSFNRVGQLEADALAEARFSSSLLALSKAHLQARHSSPEHVHDESSSLVSVPLPQSKNPAPIS